MENNKFDKAVPEKVDELSKYIGDLMVNMSQGEDVSLQQCIAFLSLVIARVFASFVVLNGVSTIYAKKNHYQYRFKSYYRIF